MTYKATLKVQFDSEWTSTHYSSGFEDSMLPEEHYTFQVPAEDLNIHQLFRFFATVARAMGHDEINIMKGGCGLAFGEEKSVKDMRKVADEFDLLLSEDFSKEVSKLNEEIWDLKSKISRLEQPENPQYTDGEMNAKQHYNEWKGLVPGSNSAVMMGCRCPVMDNEEMPDDKKWVNGDCPLHGKVTQ